MIQSPLDNTYKLHFNIRPIKVAYFLLNDDEVSLARIMRLACTQWGGIRNLIIPLDKSFVARPINEYMLKLHQPERFVAYFQMDQQPAFETLKQYLQSLFPYRNIELSFGTSFEGNERSAHALGIMSEDSLTIQNLIAPSVKGTENELISLALYGGIYPGQEVDYESATNIQKEEVILGSEQFWQDQLSTEPFSSIINLTAYGIKTFQTKNAVSSNHFDIIVVNSVSSLCMYWNCRATREVTQIDNSLGRRTLFLPEKLFSQTDALELLFSFIKRKLPFSELRGRTLTSIASNLQVRFVVWDEDTRKRCETILMGFDDLELFSESEISSMHTWQDYQTTEQTDTTIDKLTYRFMAPDSVSSYQEGVWPRVPILANLRVGKNEILYQPPVEFANRFRGEVVLDIECDVWQRIPSSPKLSEFMIPGAWFSRYGLSLIRGVNSGVQTISFDLPDESKCLELFFAHFRVDVKPSRVSQYSDALVTVVGGIDNTKLLASIPAYRLLEFLAFKSSKKIAQYLAKDLRIKESEIPEDVRTLLYDLEINPELKKVVKTYDELSTERIFLPFKKSLLSLLDDLVQLNILKRGYYLPCPRCGTPDWYPLQNSGEWLVCTGCSYNFNLPVKAGDKEVQWHYRLSSLVNRAVDQDILPAILALHHLTKDKKCACLSLGMLLQQDDQEITDLDFLYVWEQNLYAGECKKGALLNEKDLKNALMVARMGFKKFYFCTVSVFSEVTLEKISELRKQIEEEKLIMEVAVLTGHDLLGEAL